MLYIVIYILYIIYILYTVIFNQYSVFGFFLKCHRNILHPRIIANKDRYKISYVGVLRIRHLQERLKFHMVFKHSIIAHGTYRILFYNTGLSNQLLLFLVYGKSIHGYAPLSCPNVLCGLQRVVYYYRTLR